MKRVSLDRASPGVKKFIRSLPLDHEGLELELNGHVLCRIIPPSQLSEAEQAALRERAWDLVRRAQERNKGVPARVLEREVRQAVAEVRRRAR